RRRGPGDGGGLDDDRVERGPDPPARGRTRGARPTPARGGGVAGRPAARGHSSAPEPRGPLPERGQGGGPARARDGRGDGGTAMRAILAIAQNTFREAIRDRILYLLLVFALLMIAASRVVSVLTVGDEDKTINDLGLAAIGLFGVLTAIFVGIGLVFKEIDRRTIYTIVTKPIHRHQFIIGKYLGLVLTLAVNTAIMTAGYYALLLVRGAASPRLLLAIG